MGKKGRMRHQVVVKHEAGNFGPVGGVRNQVEDWTDWWGYWLGSETLTSCMPSTG